MSTPAPSSEAPYSTNKPVIGEADNTFTLSVPTLSTTLKQGETETVAIGIRRGDGFDENVTLNLSNLPTGVTADPAAPMISKGEEEANVSLTAGADAALGDFTINVTGAPDASGTQATSELKITVEKN